MRQSFVLPEQPETALAEPEAHPILHRQPKENPSRPVPVAAVPTAVAVAEPVVAQLETAVPEAAVAAVVPTAVAVAVPAQLEPAVPEAAVAVPTAVAEPLVAEEPVAVPPVSSSRLLSEILRNQSSAELPLAAEAAVPLVSE